MANNYFAKQNPTDIAIQSEDGGGLVFTQQGKYLFGSKLPDVNQQLNEESFQGNVDVDPNTNSSYIGIMNAQSEPINIDISSTNQYSLFTPPENIIIEPAPQDDCDPEFDAVLIGGLDTGGYKPLNEQLDIFKEGYGSEKKVKAFSHSTSVTAITSFLKDHPKVPVIMFSAGCKYSDKIAAVPSINKSRIYIVEPYNGSDAKTTPKAVQDAVASGVPSKNVYVGPGAGVGKGIIDNPSKTNSSKKGIDAHWDALRIVGKVMKDNIKCNSQQTQSTTVLPDPNKSTNSTPRPSPTPPTSMTAQEIEEGIYNANFLPASDNPGADLFDSDYGDECQVLTNEPDGGDGGGGGGGNRGGGAGDGGGGYNIPNLDTVINPNDLAKYIEFSGRAKGDYDDGIINPNTIIDLIAIGKAANLKIVVGHARAGHKCKTTSGNLSRHMKGYGLDLPSFYDLTNTVNNGKKTSCGGCSNTSNTNSDFKTLADKFSNTADNLPNSYRTEAGKQRGILWYFNDPKKGGNHFNHVHYSNNENYPGWSPKKIPSSFNCDCSQVRKAGLTAENCE